MRGRRANQAGLTVSLLPFLAVLICTMGALIVILVIMVQRAKVAAETISQQQIETATVAYQEQVAAREELVQQRDDFEWRSDILQERRVAMSKQLERAQAELGYAEEQLRTLRGRLSDLKNQVIALENADQPDTGKEAQLAELKKQIEIAQFELEKAEREATEKPSSYAIILHQSLHGTNRRPIYIECTRSGVYLQPEGIALRPGDFETPLGPGNPLDAALRSIRNYLIKYGGKDELPYPLLLVRPDGAHAYSKARAAMKYWDDRFGFELIEADMEIEYPEADPELAKVLNETITIARQRKAALALSMPSRYNSGGGAGQNYGGGGFDGNGQFAGGGGSQSSGAGDGFGSGGTGQTKRDEQKAALRNQFGSANSDSSGGGQFQPGSNSQPGSNGQANAGGSNSAAGENGDGGTAAMSSGAPGQQAPIANKRGKDWAIPGDTNGATAITRPIRVVVSPDRLYLYPAHRRDTRPKVISLEPGGVTGVENMVSALWREVEQWGLAGSRAYWRPTLQLQAAPGGENRLKEVQALLRGSGITTE